MKSKKLQLAVLSVLLVAVIGGGIWFLSGGTQTDGQDTTEDPQQTENSPGTSGGAEAGAFDLSSLDPMYYSLRQQEEDLPISPNGMVDNSTIYTYAEQFCLLTYRPGETAGDFAVDVVSIQTGETLHSFPGEDFPVSYDFPDTYGLVELGENFMGLSLDENGELWAYYLFWGDDEYPFEALIAPCSPDAAEDVVRLINPGSAQWGFVQKFLVRDGRAFLQFGVQLVIADLSNGSCTLPVGEDRINDFCLDRDGNVFYLRRDGSDLGKYSPKDGTLMWTKAVASDFSIMPRRISYTSPNGLFVSAAGDSGLDGIYWIDPDAGEDSFELLSFGLDVDSPPQNLVYSQFAVDDQYRVYASDYYYDFSADKLEDCESVRSVYLLEPEERAVPDAEPVTLTITAPYQVDSIAAAIRVYQRTHPEVEVLWDTQYISREEFQKNSLEYKDQLTVRVMTGDVGDLLMITGSGLSQNVITDTDVFTDLSGYLEDCPFREELGWNIIETLRSGDGAIRAVPLAARPKCCLWNAALLEELGNPVDPDHVTWMELLDLALEWQETGADFSLMMAEIEDDRQATEENMLFDLLLANLYSAEQPDGTVQLDQPYLRELLEKWSQLHGSTQLVGIRTVPNPDVLVQKNVLMYRSGLDVGDAIWRLLYSEHLSELELRAAAVPKGEVNKKQQGYAFCWGISAFSEKQEAAWELLQYLLSSDGLPGYSYTYDSITTNTAAQEKYAELNLERWTDDWNVMAKKYYDQFCALQKVPYSRLDEPYGWITAVYEPIKAYIDGEITLDEALKTANANWERFVLE